MIPSLPLTTKLRRRLAAAMAVAVTAFLPLATPGAPMAQAADAKAAAAKGYWMVASDGGVFSFGDAKFYGSTGDIKLNQPIVGMTANPNGNGYWFVASDGGVFSFGDAKFFGSMGGKPLNKPIVGMASTPTGNGYWLVASDGGIFSFGDAKFFGSTGAIKLNKPIVGMAATKSGNGYWFVASDGGIFAYGDAAFYGSTGDRKLPAPISGMAASPSGKGYWFTSTDGSIFNFGDARHFGAAADRPVAGRVMAAMVPAPDGAGYWQATSTGQVLGFGSAGDLGGLSGAPLNRPIVGMTAVPAGAVGVPGPNPTGPGPTTTGPTTVTTLPPYSGPVRFSSTALVSWGTPYDTPDAPRLPGMAPAKSRKNEAGETVYPYAQKVSAIVEIGNRVYIGGSFADLHQNNHPKTPTFSGLPMDYLAELDTNGIPVAGSPFNTNVTLDGPVRALARSADGKRLYIGGEFNHVNGVTRRRLAAIDIATGQLDQSFNPPMPNAYISAIVEHDKKVYVGGAFITMGSTSLPGLAGLNYDGSLNSAFVPPPRYPGRFEGQGGSKVENPTSGDTTGTVDSLLVTRDGKYLMVGGSFLHFGYTHDQDDGHVHGGFIAVDPNTGGLTTWQPEFNANSKSKGSRPVFGMANYPGNPTDIGINAPTLIYTAAGGVGGRVIAWTPGGSTKQLWRGGVDGDSLGVIATHDRVYQVGHFDYAVVDADAECLQSVPATCPSDTPHRHLVAWDARGEVDSTGKHTGKGVFDPTFTAQANTSEGPYAIHLGANRMYVGGNFTEVAPTPVRDCLCGVKQPGFAVYPPLQ